MQRKAIQERKTELYALRLDIHSAAKLDRIAQEKDIPPTTLARLFVNEMLKEFPSTPEETG